MSYSRDFGRASAIQKLKILTHPFLGVGRGGAGVDGGAPPPDILKTLKETSKFELHTLGNTSYNKNRFLSGIAQITSPPPHNSGKELRLLKRSSMSWISIANLHIAWHCTSGLVASEGNPKISPNWTHFSFKLH